VRAALLAARADATPEVTALHPQPGRPAEPRPGDRLVLDVEAFVLQGEPVRDRERLVWTVNTRPA